ncbi:MAG: EcsC family protein [Synechococcaceae cyanobacterium]|nr:EcsC family protein [Synechococcaceae cyanobacterium]
MAPGNAAESSPASSRESSSVSSTAWPIGRQGGSEVDRERWAHQLVTVLVGWGIDGAPIANPFGAGGLRLRTALELAEDTRLRAESIGMEAAIEALIEAQSRWNAGSGFLTGLGGFALLPLQIPAALVATWVIQTRLVATIAALHGLDLEHEAVRSRILLTLLGDQATELLRQVGVRAGQRLLRQQLERVPAASLSAINRAVGFRLLACCGRRGLLRPHQLVPVLGGVVGGGIDYMLTRRLGLQAAAELALRQPVPASSVQVIDVEVIDPLL